VDFGLLNLFTPVNLILFMAVFTRINGLMMSAPLFSTYPIPMQIKIWFTASVAFLIFPFVQASTAFAMPTNVPELFLILMKEFSIGYIIGFCANLIFVATEMAANMFSMQMGLSVSQALNPVSGTTSPVLTQVFTLLIAMTFLALDAHQWLFAAVYQSFDSMPAGYSFIFDGALVEKIIYLSGQLFIISLGIAMPIFSVLLIKDILLGFVSKLMPQMNIFMVAMPLKIYIGLLICMIFLQPIAEYVKIVLEKFLTGIMHLF